MDYNSKEFREWVGKLVETHQGTTALQLPQTFKQYCVTPGDQEEIQNRIDCLKQSINLDYVDLQTSRSIGEWLQEENLVKVLSQSGSKMQSLGCQNAEGKFLKPFEALFMLETNRLEILEDEVPWTISRAYQTILVTNEDIVKYKRFRKFALDGSDIKPPRSTLEEHQHQSKKFKAAHTSASITKRCDNSLIEGESVYFSDIFENLRMAGPRKKIVDCEPSSESFIGDSNLRFQHVDIPDLRPVKDG